MATVFGDSDSPYGVLPEHLLKKYKSIDDVPYNSLPIGTGPFRVVRWLRGNRIEFERYDRYFRGKPRLKSIVVKIIPDENTEITQLKTHEIDWFFEVSVNAYKAIRQLPAAETRMVLTPINGYLGLTFNNARGPTKDLRVRRAVSYALDKNTLVRNLTFGSAGPATEDLPSFLWAYDRSLKPTPYDPGLAMRLLAAAGYGPSHRLALDLYLDQSSVLNQILSVQVQSMLAALDVDVRTHAQLSSVFYGGYGANGTLARGHYDIALTPWTSGIDPDDSGQFTCGNLPPHGSNQSYFCNPSMDVAQRTALETYAHPDRKAAYARIQRVLDERVPIDFLWWPKHIQAVNSDLRGFDPSPVVETWDAWKWSI